MSLFFTCAHRSSFFWLWTYYFEIPLVWQSKTGQETSNGWSALCVLRLFYYKWNFALPIERLSGYFFSTEKCESTLFLSSKKRERTLIESIQVRAVGAGYPHPQKKVGIWNRHPHPHFPGAVLRIFVPTALPFRVYLQYFTSFRVHSCLDLYYRSKQKITSK